MTEKMVSQVVRMTKDFGAHFWALWVRMRPFMVLLLFTLGILGATE